jgi:hypothetical protein
VANRGINSLYIEELEWRRRFTFFRGILHARSPCERDHIIVKTHGKKRKIQVRKRILGRFFAAGETLGGVNSRGEVQDSSSCQPSS